MGIDYHQIEVKNEEVSVYCKQTCLTQEIVEFFGIVIHAGNPHKFCFGYGNRM